GYLPLVEFFSNREDAGAVTGVLDEAVARFPEDATLRLLRTEALLAQERIDEARGELTRFRQATFAADPPVDCLRARVELAQGDPRAAAQRLTELAPRLDRAATQFWLGRALEAMRDAEGARRRYTLAQQRDPTWVAPAAALVRVEQRR